MKLNKIENLIDQKPHKYNFEYECGMADYLNLPPIERWITYIATFANPKEGYFPVETINFASEAKKKYRTLADCDGSGNSGNNELIHEIYNVLFAWKNEGDNFRKVGAFKCDFGGDTMNSLFYPLIDHAGVEIKQIPKKPVMGRYSKNHLMDYFVQKETRDRFLDVLQNTCGLIDYINSYHTIGNFTLVPAGFNAYRGGKLRDYWDESLKHLKKNGFDKAQFEGVDFTKYVNYFFLWDYIGEKGKPKDLNPKSGNCSFLRTTTKYIYRRGVFMVAMLNLHKLLGEKGYAELRENVFCKSDGVYSSYFEVIDLLKKQTDNPKAKMILENCINEINAID